eukprot:TRINITY_DN14610_c0_g1_i3.p1 TRINITY_DN14610_c0_g1~~TRINITY_DN14610_c0_g1_i3.p1  ORF type:complete len:406 (-),score=120.70 TRINITY_DN14610_c0_g1_i3:283-1500(-)
MCIRDRYQRRVRGPGDCTMALRQPPDSQLKVASTSDAKRVASAICGRLHEIEGTITVLASGAASVNQAVKAVAIARRHLRESGTELLMSATFPVASRSGSVVLAVSTCEFVVESQAENDSMNLVVKPASDPPRVAGAIANRTRLGEPVRLVARGKDSVMVAVESLAAAVNYLKGELAMLVAPRFIETESADGESLTMMCFDILGSGDFDKAIPEHEQPVEPQSELKVASTSDARKVAKAICGRMDDSQGAALTLLASGATSVNQAVKAIAIARKNMRDCGTELVMAATFPVASRSSSVVFTLSTTDIAVEAANDESTSLVVKPSSMPAKVAGAVAGRSRQGDVVQLVAKGKESVLIAVEALVAAVTFLENDLRLLVAPRFIQTEEDNGTGGKVTLMCFDILAQSL